ncbi:M20/M25/M40 family metallo-hydrolase [uncultured Algimonas sp.]|uniref:M20/M25/M40 family metallo-hydrolase n=1 Tax=uncultured Algimonas sp. TaxID=1547920 RepID=UPI002603A8AF|nr:M20/M25/M40 family metallo-hydrolase [uncultured Algimonas sp.]
MMIEGLARRAATALAVLAALNLEAAAQQAAPQAATPDTADATSRAILEAARSGTQGYDIVEGLTTEIGARLAGTPEEARARDWTAAKFREIGLENVRIEPFTIPGWIRGVETARITAPYPQQMLVTALGGSVATPADGIEAEVVYFPTFDALEAAPLASEGGDLAGKIVFISGRMEKAPDGAGYGPANVKRQRGATEAGRRGAAAVIIRSVGTDSRRFPHTGQMRYADDVPPIPIAALSAPDADQLERILERGETVEVFLKVRPHFFGDAPSGNVIGEIVGTERPEEIVLIGAHLDSWDLGTGAVDDGAGIGIVAGAAQVLIEAGLRPKRTIRVVAFGAEEVGLLGAFEYADAHADTVENHVLATESDFGAEPPYEVLINVGEGDAVIRDVAATLGLPIGDRTTTGGPDIIPLARAGVPVMRFQQDGTDYFDLHHTPDDTLDKIDPDDIAENVAAFALMAWTAANAETDFRADADTEG